MRRLVWIAVLVGSTQIATLAHAQSDSGTKAGAYTAGPGTTPPGYKADALSPENCGTPDNPKACPPMPKRALKHYPAKPTNG
jgi:hypothetical protein